MTAAEPTPRKSPWRRTPFQRRIADFQRFLIRHRMLLRSVACAFALGVMCGAIVLGLPGWVAHGLEFAKTKLGTRIGLKVEVISIAGLQHLSKREVSEALAIPAEASLLDIDVAAARARVANLAWVKDVTITRLPPNRLHVAITEYQPAILWQDKGKSFAVDATGHVIAPVNPLPFGALPHVTGKGAAEAAPDLMAWLNAMPEVARHVFFSERVGDRRWNLHFGNQLMIELPDRGLDEALAVLTRMITKDSLLKRDVVVVDLRDPKEPRLTLGDDAARALHVSRDNS
jgi:cell division protein FtsQ